MPVHPKDITEKIKFVAAQAGFFQSGIARAEFIAGDAENLERWLSNNYHGDMHYMENNIARRTDPRKLVENARSVIVLLYNYYPSERLPHSS